MKKWILPFIGLAPTSLSYATNAIQMSQQVKDNIHFNFQDVNLNDDWKEDNIIIDFSTINRVSSSAFDTFDLDIEKKIKTTKSRGKHCDIKLTYHIDGKNYIEHYGILWEHKGFWLGQMISDFLRDNQKIEFKNLIRGDTFGYDWEQPDRALIVLFIFTFKVYYSNLVTSYTDPSWFMAITGFTGTENLVDTAKEYSKLAKKREGRFLLNQKFFSINSNEIKNVWEYCLMFVEKTSILEGYDVNEMWSTKFIELNN